FLLVLIGALVPVVPTGALVSSAAVVAFHQTAPFSMALVFVTAALAAFLGDMALYWLGRRGMKSRGGSRWLEAIRARAPEDRLARREGAGGLGLAGGGPRPGTGGPAGAGPGEAGRPRRGGAGAVPADAGRAAPGDAGVPAGEVADAPLRPRQPPRLSGLGGDVP